MSLLKTHSYYGMKPGQISIVKQNKIPAILDNDCHLALENNKLLIETKPHGHGDIHYLLYQSGKAKQWIDEGKRYMVQFMAWCNLWTRTYWHLIACQLQLEQVLNIIMI